MNYNKTSLYRMGSLGSAKASIYVNKQIKWVQSGISILGVDINEDESAILNDNYQKIIDKLDSLFAMWRKRSLSLEGKVNMLNSLVGSLFVYKMSVLPCLTRSLTERIEAKIVNFLWNGARPKIPLDVLKLAKKDRGLNLFSLSWKDTALKVSWVETITTDVQIASLAYLSLNQHLKEHLWCCNLSEKDVPVVLAKSAVIENPFWRDVLKSWCLVNFSNRLEKWHPIWFNSLLRIEKFPFFLGEAISLEG